MRLVVFACALAIVGVACAQPTAEDVDLAGRGFVRFVADFYDDVGVAPSIAVDQDGVPYVAAFAFEATLKPGQLPVQRPIGAPSLPAVTVTSLADGIWTRGAAAMQAEVPNVDVAYTPAVLKQLEGQTPDGVNGTSITVDGGGALHVAWASGDGYWYATNAGGGFAAGRITRADPAAGMGAPSVAVDAGGSPWVAFTSAGEEGQSVVAATPDGERWELQDVAGIACDPCEAPQPTKIGIGSDGNPFVVYADTAASTPMFAASSDGTWEEPVPVEKAGGGVGLSMAVDTNGDPRVAYFTPAGDEVHLATAAGGGGWDVATVASVGTGVGTGAATTSVAVDDQGTSYVTWYDPASDAIRLATGSTGALSEVPLRGTRGSRSPAVAVTADGGSVFLAWYDHVNGDLALGVFGETGELILAQPSPTEGTTAPPTEPPATPTEGPTTAPEAPCEPKGTKLEIAAPVGAVASGFDIDCLAVPTGEDFTIAFDNQDIGVPHNVAIYEADPLVDAAAADFFIGDTITGPDKIDYEVGGIEEGVWFFRCDIHPTTMTGDFVSK